MNHHEAESRLRRAYEHATPEDFARAMTQTYSEISQQRGGQALEFDQRDMTEIFSVSKNRSASVVG